MKIIATNTFGYRSALAVICTVVFVTLTTHGQAPAAPISVDEIVSRAAERSKAYREAFTRLLSEEKKIFEIFDKKGEVKKRREIDSTLLVYQLSRSEGSIAEFRNVTSVDGKKLSSTDERAKDFFEKVTAAGSSQKELDDIREESSRYDADFAINGLTLFQAVPLMDGIRDSFEFHNAGKDRIDGHEVYVVEYEQTRPNRAITVNGTGSHNYDIEIDDSKTALDTRLRGKLWIDTDTFNLRKEERTRTIQAQGYPTPVIVSENRFEYTDSAFGILTPKRIEHTQYLLKLKDGERRKDIHVSFGYGPFTKPDVEVRSAEVKDKN